MMDKKEYMKKWREKNKEHIKKYSKKYRKKYYEENKEYLRQYSIEYHHAHREEILEKQKVYRENEEVKERLKENNKKWRYGPKRKEMLAKKREWSQSDRGKESKKLSAARNRATARKWRKNKYHNDIQYKLTTAIRSRVRIALNNNQKTGSAIDDLGCSVDELKIYLENQFEEGMTWDNWKHDGWHIDHIKPLSKFDLTDPVQFKEAVHYTNLQPLWWKENLKKGNKRGLT